MADSISATTTVVGVKDALRVLNRIDKQARRDLTKDFKQITAPVTNDIKAKLPKSAPLSGMARKWTTASGFQMFPYSDKQNKVASGVSGKKVREFRGASTNLATFFIRYTGPSAALLDMSGKGKVPTRQGGQMVQSLSAKYGTASRFVWPAWERNKNQVEGEVETLIDRLMERVRKELN
jgi:hypothetical protein